MFTKKVIFTLLVFIILFGGFGYLIATGRPVVNVLQTDSGSNSPASFAANTSTATVANPSTGQFTLAQVTSHATEADCWTTIEGSVYDLTSWISRHPGGPEAIIGLCGHDGTTAFVNQHGNGRRARAALTMLKIGELAK